jgi:formylglycine-generating enzyme required for sulfatase activity
MADPGTGAPGTDPGTGTPGTGTPGTGTPGTGTPGTGTPGTGTPGTGTPGTPGTGTPGTDTPGTGGGGDGGDNGNDGANGGDGGSDNGGGNSNGVDGGSDNGGDSGNGNGANLPRNDRSLPSPPALPPPRARRGDPSAGFASARVMSQPEAPIDVFISYKREERDVAKALAGALARRGYKVWWDIELLPGDRFVDAIMAVIERAKAVIVLWSQHAVASDFVRAEAREAYKQDKLIPVRLEPCDPPLPFGELQTLDLEAWWPEADETMLEPLLRALEARIGKPPAPPQPQAATEANLHSQDREADYWRSVSERQPQSAKEYLLYLQRYPNGVFVDLARLRIEELDKAGAAGKATRAIVTTKNVIIALGALAVAGTAMLTFGDQFLVRCQSWGWCATADDNGGSEGVEVETADELPWSPPPGLPVPEMIRIPPGDEPLTFTMGSTTGFADERPTRNVTIAEPFHMSQTPITFEHYAAFAQAKGHKVPAPADFRWNDAPATLPVVGVDWQHARDYAEWLGEQTGASCRLPSEAEWEFACRAGTTTAYWWGDDFDPTMANTREGGPVRPTPVGTFPPTPNDWGLYDMSGNVWEWIEDHWHNTYQGAPSGGSAWIDGQVQDNSPRLLRGGSWDDFRGFARCALRSFSNPLNRSYSIGFRVVCSSPS